MATATTARLHLSSSLATPAAGRRSAALGSRRATCSVASLGAQTVRGLERLAAVVVAARKSEVPASAVYEELRQVELPAGLKQAAAVVVGNLVLGLPALAEPGKIFDFNLTLPIMMGQFILLMILLDKLVFSPVGKVLDERDEKIRGMLVGAKDNSSDILKMQSEAEALVSKARADAQASINDAKKATDAECQAKLAAAKKKIDGELATALKAMEAEKAKNMSGLDSQVGKLSDEIVRKLIPSSR